MSKIGPIIPERGSPTPRPKPTPAPKPPPPKPIGPTGSIRFADEDARDIAAARARSDYGQKPPPATIKKPSTLSTPSTPSVDQGAIDRERDRLAREQAERERLAREAAAREAARREAERLAEEARKAARLYALARQPVLLPIASREPVKHATPGDILIDDNELPIDLIIKLTLEKIGGIELISLVRHDTVNGQNIVYRPIKNVSQLAIEYNSQNLVKMPNSSDSYFDNFPIKLDSHMIQTTNILPPTSAYIDRDTENVIIELVNLKADYEIEVQMVSVGKVFDDTIYTEEN